MRRPLSAVVQAAVVFTVGPVPGADSVLGAGHTLDARIRKIESTVAISEEGGKVPDRITGSTAPSDAGDLWVEDGKLKVREHQDILHATTTWLGRR